MNKKQETRSKKSLILAFSCIMYLISSISLLHAEEFTSSSFKVLDPVLAPAGHATSTSFQLWSTLGELVFGTSSAPSFTLSSGFLRFPTVTFPQVSATAGNAQVALSWSASVGLLGLTPATYSVGRSTISGASYTYTNVGNVLSATQSSLTNNTPYYFVVVAHDSFGNAIATSSEVSSTPVAPSNPGGGGGGGGGGSVSLASSNDGVVFKGLAYPESIVTLIKNGIIVSEVPASPSGTFEIKLGNVSPGTYTFGIRGEDQNRLRSTLDLFTVYVAAGATTVIDGIFLPPTITVEKDVVKKGDIQTILGKAAPLAGITLLVNSETAITKKFNADNKGNWLYKLDTTDLEIGDHETKARGSTVTDISNFSEAIHFKVGTENIAKKKTDTDKSPCGNGVETDINCDKKVNIVDFSIMAFWYKRTGFPKSSDMNKDGKIDLVDFSIMAYHWTG